MINELRVSQDIQAFQKDIALDELSSIIIQQARRNVIIVDDASTDGHDVEKTLKQITDTFMQNMNKISKINNKDEEANVHDARNWSENSNQFLASWTLALSETDCLAHIVAYSPIRCTSRTKLIVRSSPQNSYANVSPSDGETQFHIQEIVDFSVRWRHFSTGVLRSAISVSFEMCSVSEHRLMIRLVWDVQYVTCIECIHSWLEFPLDLTESPVITPSESVKSLIDTELKVENLKNTGVQSMQMEVPSIELFTSLEAAAISCVLEEFLDQLATIGFMIPAKVDSRWDDTFKTIDKMYGVPDEPRIIFREDMGLLPIVPTEAEKIQRDRNYVYQVLKRVLCDIKNNGRFDSLQKEIDNIVKNQESKCNLEADAQIWLNQAEELREQLESDKKAKQEERKNIIKLVQESDAQIDNAIFLNSGKLGYAEKWEKARLEQQELKLHLQKEDMLNKLSDYSKEYNAEQIISAEMNAYLEADIKEKEEQVIIWTKRYNEEIVERQQEIDELKRLIEEQKLEMEEMRTLIDKQQKIIDECITEEKRLQEKAKLNRAATIIQSIWRGHMVRQELGKYRNLRKRLTKRKKLSKQKKNVDEKKKRLVKKKI